MSNLINRHIGTRFAHHMHACICMDKMGNEFLNKEFDNLSIDLHVAFILPIFTFYTLLHLTLVCGLFLQLLRKRILLY